MSTTILVVDDDQLFRELLARVLAEEGYMVETASGGVQALQVFNAEPPDLVITDILMPGGDGIELIAAIRARNPKLPILAFTASAMLADLNVLQIAEQLGATTLIKPFDGEELLRAVEKALATPGRGLQ